LVTHLQNERKMLDVGFVKLTDEGSVLVFTVHRHGYEYSSC